MTISRRYFLKSGGIAMLGHGFAAIFFAARRGRYRCAEQKKDGRAFPARRDGRAQRRRAVRRAELLPLAPHDRYSRAAARGSRTRPSISTASSACIPALQPLQPLFQNGQLAIVHAVGSPDPTRSHFDAQDFMESGTPGVKATEDGWLNRALQATPEDQRLAIPRCRLRAVSAAHACRAARPPLRFRI